MSSPDGTTVSFRRVPADLRPRALSLYARKLETLVARGRSFDCLITGDAELRKLNREFRSKDYATDVLSFPSGDDTRLGDIAISLQRARAQAREFGHTAEEEVRVLMLHGLLHLLGHDHETDEGQMARAEKRWRARLNLPASLTERAQC